MLFYFHVLWNDVFCITKTSDWTKWGLSEFQQLQEVKIPFCTWQTQWWSISSFINFWTHQKKKRCCFLRKSASWIYSKEADFGLQTFLANAWCDNFMLPENFVIFAPVQKKSICRAKLSAAPFWPQRAHWTHRRTVSARASSMASAATVGLRSHGHIKSKSHAHRHSPGHWSSEP